MAARLDVKEGLQRALHITVPAQEWQEHASKLLTQRAKSAKIDGFRPGKAPFTVVKKIYGPAMEEKALDELISKHLVAACQANEVVPVSRPVIDALTAEPHKDVEFTAVFEVEPTIDKVHFEGAAVEKVVSEVADQDVDKVIDNLREQLGRFVECAEAAQNNDRVTIDFCGYVDGEAFEGGKAEGFPLVLGKGQMIPGFEEPLLGMKAGESKRIAVTFPDNYPAPLTAKAAEFDITVHKVERHEKVELTEDFFHMLGVKDGQLSTLQAEIRATLEREMTKTLRNMLRDQVFNKLLEVNDILVPEAEVHHEIHQLMDQAKARFKEHNPKQTMPELPHDMFKPEAEKRVKLGYLVRALIRLADLKVDDSDVRLLAEEMAAVYENPAEVIRYHMDDQQRYQQLKALALEYKVVQHLLDLAQVTEKKVAHADLKAG